MKCVLIAASMLTLCAAGRSQNCPDSKLTVQVRVSWICPHIEKYNNQLSCATYLGDPSDPQGTKAAQSALVNANSYLPVCLKLMGTVSTVMDKQWESLSRNWKKEDQRRFLAQRKSQSFAVLDLVVVESISSDKPDKKSKGFSSPGYSLRSAGLRHKKPGDYVELDLKYDGIAIRRKYVATTTLPHEVGHWLGLLETFETCDDFGDDVDDTVAESPLDSEEENSSIFPRDSTCSVFRAHLKLKYGKDKRMTKCKVEFKKESLENMMEYTACRRKFSRHQIDAMLDVWEKRQSL